jgi:hypothetical protein
MEVLRRCSPARSRCAARGARRWAPELAVLDGRRGGRRGGACRGQSLAHDPPSPSRAPLPLPCQQLLKGNTFAGTAFFSYGSFWVSWAFFQTMTRLTQGAENPSALGFVPDAGFKVGTCIALAAWGFFTFGFFVPTLRKNGCLMTVGPRGPSSARGASE